MEKRIKTAAETDTALRETLHQMPDEDLLLLACRTKPGLFQKGSLEFRLASWTAGWSPLLVFIVVGVMANKMTAGAIAGVLCLLPVILWRDAKSL